MREKPLFCTCSRIIELNQYRINLVDAFDAQCFAESKNVLFTLLADEHLGHCPILVLGNKIDRPGAASEEKLRVYFELHNTTGKVRNIFNLTLTASLIIISQLLF
jgi:signal recognition particle receptor subunit beta